MKRFSFLFAFVLALSTFFSPFASADTQTGKKLVALGDSITYGWNLEADHSKPSTSAFPYLIGTGDYTVSTNISFPGWRSDQLLAELPKPESLAAMQGANLFTVNIGNNDLLQTPEVALIINKLKVDPAAVVTPQEIGAATNAIFSPTGTAAKIGANLQQIIGAIRAVNPTAPIILYNMYNPFGASSPTLHAIGEQIIPAINQNVIVPIAMASKSNLANAYAAFNGKQETYILPGDIHPTKEGHQALAKLANDILVDLEPLSVSLSPSSTGSTQGPVTISVSTNVKTVQQMSYLPGVKTVADFATGNPTPITDNKFDVTVNGTFTVLVVDGQQRTATATITVSNISNPTPTPNPDPTPGDDGSNNPGDNDNGENPAPAPQDDDQGTPAPVPTDSDEGQPLPDTATPIYNYLAIGSGLVLIGFVLMKLPQVRRRGN